jgi:hypothetical protein
MKVGDQPSAVWLIRPPVRYWARSAYACRSGRSVDRPADGRAAA